MTTNPNSPWPGVVAFIALLVFIYAVVRVMAS